MGYEESKKHLLSLSYHELQSLCKRYNLPANKSHIQLASSLALLLEASLASSSVLSPGAKEASTCSQNNLKRGSYSGKDDDRLLIRAKHQKGLQVAVDEMLKRGISTSTSISPVSINPGRTDCQNHSPSPGNAYNVQSQSDVGIANKSLNLKPANEHCGSPANGVDQISAPIIPKHPVIDNGLVSAPIKHAEDTTDKVRGPSDIISANATPVQFFVMSDEGINLVVDLNSTPSTWAENFKAEVCIPSYSEPGSFSSFISSLISRDDHSTISPSGNIVVDIQSKGAETESITPSTNSSLGSDVGDNSHSEPCPTDTTANSVSSASTLPSALVEISGYQEGAPVISSSCLTAEVQNNVTSSITASALDNEELPAEFVVVLDSERISAPLFDASVKPSGNNDTMSPGKTKVSGKSTQNVSVADADSISLFSSGDVVRSTSNVLSPKSAGKQTFNVCGGAQLAPDCDSHEVLAEPMEAAAMEKDTEFGDRLSISCQLGRQIVGKPSVTDARSDASSADHCIAGPGSFDATNPASSSAASDNTMNPLTSKCCAESVQSRDSTDKKSVCDPEELELESNTPHAYSEPPRNILLSLRSASARQTKSSALPRRSARLVQK